MKRPLGYSIAGAVLISIVLLVTWYSTAGQDRLSASLTEESGDLGIPGVTKVYKAELHNWGLHPRWIVRCDYVDDSMSPGVELAYDVERWDTSRGQWTRTGEADGRNFCKPFPLGIIKAKLHGAWLWPGESLSTSEEATAARDGIHRGDHVRFIIFLGKPGDSAHSLTTPATIIDEASTSDEQLRIAH